MAIFNNGHTIEVEYHEGSYIIYNEKQYNVLQFHFHQPSEHTINGETFPMEMHIVHQNAESGQLAVVGVMLREGDVADADYADIFANLPVDVSQPDEEAETMIDAATLLPDDTETFFTYEGSLTTPPCSQIVRWLVMADPVTLTADQIAAFGEIYDGNARPVQPLNTRDLFTNAG
jgi:carbonic anhydrase